MSQAAEKGEFLILTEPEVTPLGAPSDVLVSKRISAGVINENLRAFISRFGDILTDVSTMGTFGLVEVTVNIGISAEGEIQLIGLARGKTSVTTGILLKFQKPPVGPGGLA